MTAFKPLDDRTLVAGQIHADDLAEARRQGVTLIVNNRPDGEDEGQPSSAEIEAAAKEAGLAYHHIPIVRGIGPSDVEQLREARDRADGKTLLFCRSGMRSTLAWAVACREEGVPREELEKKAADAGYSLAAVSHLL